MLHLTVRCGQVKQTRQETRMIARNGANRLYRYEMTHSCEKVALASAADAHFGGTAGSPAVVPSDISAVSNAHPCGLSVRAVNVLKLLAAEITGKSPPRDNWTPSNALLRQLTAQQLLTARNCGPQTANEIIRWAASRGIAIKPLLHSGKSLSEMWQDLNTRFMAGELAKAEVAQALEKSVRRKSSTIPVAVQKILLMLLSTGGK
jgi:hypothetical protein